MWKRHLSNNTFFTYEDLLFYIDDVNIYWINATNSRLRTRRLEHQLYRWLYSCHIMLKVSKIDLQMSNQKLFIAVVVAEDRCFPKWW